MRKKEKRRKKVLHRRAREKAAKQRGRRSVKRSEDLSMVKEEILQREKEWREAWIIYDLKIQQDREKEKAVMREQWKDEREKWALKLNSVTALL